MDGVKIRIDNLIEGCDGCCKLSENWWRRFSYELKEKLKDSILSTNILILLINLKLAIYIKLTTNFFFFWDNYNNKMIILKRKKKL